ncbi:hypothetical protein [Cytobacillus firmus]|uniref:hypothetical protein n=1 Tax=Cytobacillus firmus TaxID=1399 RepID=UPI00203B3404|nr:hypothetical protein [Cytobacillus firmus]
MVKSIKKAHRFILYTVFRLTLNHAPLFIIAFHFNKYLIQLFFHSLQPVVPPLENKKEYDENRRNGQ